MKALVIEEPGRAISGLLIETLEKALTRAGLNISVTVDAAPSNLFPALSSASSLDELSVVAYELLGAPKDPFFVIAAVSPRSTLANLGQSVLSHAKWGFTQGNIAVDYADESSRHVNQVHECLHALGAEDCYDANDPKFPTIDGCTRDDCVMRYGSSLWLPCSKVIGQLRYTWSEMIRKVIYIDLAGKEHNGEVLGVTKDHFWLLVFDLQTVFVGHPRHIEERNGKEYFDIFDHSVRADKLFNSQNLVDSYIFDAYCDDPADMKRYLNTLRLIRAL